MISKHHERQKTTKKTPQRHHIKNTIAFYAKKKKNFGKLFPLQPNDDDLMQSLFRNIRMNPPKNSLWKSTQINFLILILPQLIL